MVHQPKYMRIPKKRLEILGNKVVAQIGGKYTLPEAYRLIKNINMENGTNIKIIDPEMVEVLGRCGAYYDHYGFAGGYTVYYGHPDWLDSSKYFTNLVIGFDKANVPLGKEIVDCDISMRVPEEAIGKRNEVIGIKNLDFSKYYRDSRYIISAKRAEILSNDFIPEREEHESETCYYEFDPKTLVPFGRNLRELSREEWEKKGDRKYRFQYMNHPSIRALCIDVDDNQRRKYPYEICFENIHQKLNLVVEMPKQDLKPLFRETYLEITKMEEPYFIAQNTSGLSKSGVNSGKFKGIYTILDVLEEIANKEGILLGIDLETLIRTFNRAKREYNTVSQVISGSTIDFLKELLDKFGKELEKLRAQKTV
jgi:hypothetical protein